MRYLNSVFIQDKCVHQYFADGMDDLVTILGLYKGCSISVFDLVAFRALTSEEIKEGIAEVRFRLSQPYKPIPVRKTVTRAKHQRHQRRQVRCVETNQVFESVRECSDHLGIPYTTIINCINRGNPTRGLHFGMLTMKEEQHESEE